MFDSASSPSVHMEGSLFESVLAYCMKQVGEDKYLSAMQYGRKSGFFDADGLLTMSGLVLAKFEQLDIQDAA